MQELDLNVESILRDLVGFLESLAAELPGGLPASRESLLLRCRGALERLSLRNGESPEPYLDMRPGRPQEYANVDADKRERGSLHYYEPFQAMDDVLQIYRGLSAAQARSRAAKSGGLVYLKREPKMFAPFNVLWPNKLCWVSLLGTHLLLYAGERDGQPQEVIGLRGYKCRAAPGAIPRDPRRSEAALELYCPGERTYQFLARDREEMQQWVDAVAERLQPEEAEPTKRAPTFVEILELESNERMCIEVVKEEKERYQDVFAAVKPEAPPLPARTRRLPSLPSQERVAYEPREEAYDDEGLYHRIEDVRAQYENCQVRASQDEGAQETYDDVRSLEPLSYDDVRNVAKPLKSPTKLSFLNRMINRRESLKREERSKPAKSELPPCSDDAEENYLTPPPPRPIYSRPPTIVKCTEPAEDIYDDIGAGCKGCADGDVVKDYPKNGSFLSDLQLSIDQEHYQVPRSAGRRVADQEELYDDVKISESFRSRASPEKSVWSRRFGSGKKPRRHDDSAEDGAGEQSARVKPIQRLISKMENTLGKVTKSNGVA